MRKLIDESGKTLGVLEGGKFLPADPRVEGWDKAVPSVRGVEHPDGFIVEEDVSVPESDPRYGIAFASALEERGWRFEDEG